MAESSRKAKRNQQLQMHPWATNRGKRLQSPQKPPDHPTTAVQEPSVLPLPDPALPGGFAGSTVAPRKALSRWLCCFASCSRVSSSRIRWSLSYCSDFCHFLLCVWANMRKSLQAYMEKVLVMAPQLVRLPTKSPYSGNTRRHMTIKYFLLFHSYQGQPAVCCNQGQTWERVNTVVIVLFSWSRGPSKYQVSSKPRQGICGSSTKGGHVNCTQRATGWKAKGMTTAFNNQPKHVSQSWELRPGRWSLSVPTTQPHWTHFLGTQLSSSPNHLGMCCSLCLHCSSLSPLSKDLGQMALLWHPLSQTASCFFHLLTNCSILLPNTCTWLSFFLSRGITSNFKTHFTAYSYIGLQLLIHSRSLIKFA